jgi:large subunit ribosomal protein L6
MSRIGQKPVDIIAGVTVTVDDRVVKVKGKEGELSRQLPPMIEASVADGKVTVTRIGDTREARSYHGMARTLISNMISGVAKGYSREMEIQGVGFKAVLKGQKLALSLGFASPVDYAIPAGVKVTEEGGVKLVVRGPDKQLVGDTAARIRSFFPAEPYKGKGIRYKDERVRRKVGKTVA